MQRIINHPDQVVDDALAGYLAAYPELFKKTDNPRVVCYANSPKNGKVGIITGGGSGHEPAFLGYIGHHLLDAVAIGEIFSSPTANSFLDAAKAADQGAGVACLYGNYAGDNMNVKMACKMAEKQGIHIKTVIANDDVASAPLSEKEKRRGVAGEIFMWKIAAASAARGDSLEQVINLAQHAINCTRSIGIGLSSCTIPAVGKPNFDIPLGQMELGIGHHGEPGMRKIALTTATDIAKMMLEPIIADLPFNAHDEVAIILSGLGVTPHNELHLLYADVKRQLDHHNITAHRVYIGNYFTSLDMAGATLTLMQLDDELKILLDTPAQSLALTQVEVK